MVNTLWWFTPGKVTFLAEHQTLGFTTIHPEVLGFRGIDQTKINNNIETIKNNVGFLAPCEKNIFLFNTRDLVSNACFPNQSASLSLPQTAVSSANQVAKEEETPLFPSVQWPIHQPTPFHLQRFPQKKRWQSKVWNQKNSKRLIIALSDYHPNGAPSFGWSLGLVWGVSPDLKILGHGWALGYDMYIYIYIHTQATKYCK